MINKVFILLESSIQKLLIPSICSVLYTSIDREEKEPNIVKNFVEEIKKKKYLIRIKYKDDRILDVELKINSEFIHQKPYAIFLSNKPCGKKRVELGDLLFRIIIKDGNKNKKIKDKATIFQIKLSKNKPCWRIPGHQHEFLINIDKYPFRFAKYNSSDYICKDASSEMKKLFGYLLICKNCKLDSYNHHMIITLPFLPFSKFKYFEIFNILYKHSYSCKDIIVNFNLNRIDICTKIIEFTPSIKSIKFSITLNLDDLDLISFNNYLNKFILNDIGLNLLNCSEAQRLINELYKFVGLKEDPPEEFEEYSRENGVFGIVEFNIQYWYE